MTSQRPSCSAVGLSKRRAMQTLSDLTMNMAMTMSMADAGPNAQCLRGLIP